MLISALNEMADSITSSKQATFFSIYRNKAALLILLRDSSLSEPSLKMEKSSIINLAASLWAKRCALEARLIAEARKWSATSW